MTSSKAGLRVYPTFAVRAYEKLDREIQRMADLVHTARYLSVILGESLEISMRHDHHNQKQIIAVKGERFARSVEEKTFLAAARKLTTALRADTKEAIRERRKKEKQEARTKSS